MKKSILCLLLTLTAVLANATESLSLVPYPAKLERQEGQFQFKNQETCYIAPYQGDSICLVFHAFEQTMSTAAGVQFKPVKRASKARFVLQTADSLAPEAYRLRVTPRQVVIEAARPAGFFYALQTLKQLLPRHVMAGVAARQPQPLTLPAIQVDDSPRFGWRGFMLDEGRHFYGKAEIKKILDVMSVYKLNRFHWHLTEDQGWRIEIKKYPRLTSTGAWRQSKVLGWGDTKPDGQRYGGFYTQEDIQEVVDYARERFIEIVPEVDIPGHSQAAVASYPDILSCDPQQPHEVWLWQGISADVINVANPAAVQFAKDVIDELTALFPFGYIHLGGDECPTAKWEQNADCQQLLAQIGSKNYRDLQIHFYKQLKDYIAQKPQAEQRKLIFWNEVLHGNTAPLGNDITIMAWIGADGAAQEAAKRGMTTILSPQIPYYINRKQSKLPTEPHSQGYGDETVEAVYAYKPMHNVPFPLRANYLGVQANFWTEWVEEPEIVEYLMLPRLAAVAEAGWTPAGQRDYKGFRQRIQADQDYYRQAGLHYGKHIFE